MPVKKHLLRFFFLLLAILALFVAFISYRTISDERRFRLSHVPDALHVTSIAYSKESNFGIGLPGDEESGMIVYPLSSQIADEISQTGMAFFNNKIPPTDPNERNWRGKYGGWSQTPIRADDKWGEEAETGNLNLYHYICRSTEGACIPIDDAVLKQATEIVNGGGNYYAYQEHGLIVVSPGRKRVLFMYNK